MGRAGPAGLKFYLSSLIFLNFKLIRDFLRKSLLLPIEITLGTLQTANSSDFTKMAKQPGFYSHASLKVNFSK